MDTSIGYLELVREDLLDAGQRDGRRRFRLPSVVPRFRPRTLVAAATAVTLLAAGTVGWLVTRDVRRFEAATAGAAGPTGATAGGPDVDDRAGLFLPPIPQVTPQGVAADDTATTSLDLSRVIRTAELGLEIPPGSFDDRFADAVDVAEAHGGFVATSTARERSGNLTIRVPASSFDEALRDLRELGDVQVQTIQGRDVTAEYVDLRARLRIARARRQVLLRLMDRAPNIPQTIRVQNALDDTQLLIEELEGQIRLLDDRVALATVRVQLREEGVEPEAEVETPSIPNAFERSVAGFVGVIAGVVVGLGYVIPVLALAALGWFVVSRVRRRRAP